MLITLRRPRLTIKDISYFPCPSSCFHTFLGNVTRVYPTHWKPHRRLTFSLHFPHLLTISLGSFCSSLFEANFSTRTRIYTHIVQKKRKEKEKKNIRFNEYLRVRNSTGMKNHAKRWNFDSRHFTTIFCRRGEGEEEREKEKERIAELLNLHSRPLPRMEKRKRRTKGQKFKINTCRGRFGKEIVIRVKHLSPLNKGIFLRIIRTLLFL